MTKKFKVIMSPMFKDKLKKMNKAEKKEVCEEDGGFF